MDLLANGFPVTHRIRIDKHRNANEEEAIIDLPKPRRNSIDFSKESDEVLDKKFENQVSDYSHRRYVL